MIFILDDNSIGLKGKCSAASFYRFSAIIESTLGPGQIFTTCCAVCNSCTHNQKKRKSGGFCLFLKYLERKKPGLRTQRESHCRGQSLSLQSGRTWKREQVTAVTKSPFYMVGMGPEGAGAEGLRGLGLLCHGGAASCPLRQGRSSGDTGRGGKEDWSVATKCCRIGHKWLVFQRDNRDSVVSCSLSAASLVLPWFL